ncbi:uncharacterized protein JCM6883_004688 [Sporobolomyces salmoneus]|uniref:uncharacterized protein n=1 Tax=Sporobolomyces salmoneus TaxID=183962 RepID=UPI00316C06CF
MPSVEADPYYAGKYVPLQDRKADIHYRAAKGKILRSLGACTYRNGSQFAIVWVSPSGEVADAYASEAFQPKLEEWLGSSVQQDAKEIAKSWRLDKERRKSAGEERLEVEGVYSTEGIYVFSPDQIIDEEMSDGEGMERTGSTTSRGATSSSSTSNQNPMRPRSRTGGATSSSERIPSSSNHRSTRSITTLDGGKAQQHPSPSFSANSVTSPIPTSSTLSSNGQTPALKLTREELDGWFTSRLSELSHKTDKIVCRSWIKAIEPHKQTRFPYQKGEETKPSWWPPQMRHKEPDHLAKQERIGLLLHLLRLPHVTIGQLEAATGAVQMQIPTQKLPIIQSIYEAAKAERKAIANSPSGNYDTVSIEVTSLSSRSEVVNGDEDDLSGPLVSSTETRSGRPQRTRNKNAIGSPSTGDLSMTQQTPRAARASPYPLVRSASATHELSNLTLNSATSPSLGHSPASTSLSRSQSYAGLNNGSTARAPRLNGRASIGESDLQATPYQGGRVRTSITPRQAAAQSSPLSSSSMGRSASTSAIGAKTMMDDSVASPAMIKSRSKLSQRCFEQMGAGTSQGPSGGNDTEGGGERVEHRLPSEFAQFPQPHFTMIHPHHLQSLRPHPEGFPPPPPSSASTQQHHLARHSQSQNPHQAPSQRPHSHSHSQHPQVQVQVQVHAGHGLPIPPQAQHPSFPSYAAHRPPPSQAYSNSPVPQQSQHFSPNPQQPQTMHFVAPNGLVYEHAPTTAILPHQIPTNDEAYYAPSNGTPSLSGYINSPELSQHSFGVEEAREYPMLQNVHEGGGGGTGTEHFDTNAYLNSSQFANANSVEPDLGAYVRDLEGLERQQAQQDNGESAYEMGLGFESSQGQYDLSSSYIGNGNEEYHY